MTGESSRTVVYKLKTGADAKDYSSLAKKDALQPMEVELRKIEDQVQAISESLAYLRSREEEMRDTNGISNLNLINTLNIFVFPLI